MNVALILPEKAYQSFVHGEVWGEDIDSLGIKKAIESLDGYNCEILTSNIIRYLEDTNRLSEKKISVAIHFDWPSYRIENCKNILFFQQFYEDIFIQRALNDFHNYDLVITNSYCISQKYANIHYFPLAVDAELFSPGKVVESLKSDVVFIGNTKMRGDNCYEQYLKPATKFSLDIYGNGWDQESYKDYVSFYRGIINIDDMVDVYRSTKIVLCIHNKAYMEKYGLVTNRVFHALSIGKVLVSDPHPVMMEMFPNEVGVVYTTGQEHTEKILENLLNDSEKRLYIANQGRKEVLKNHTWIERVTPLFIQD
ncbi:glycosyltransferase [Bacillus cereus group sp. BfR-BA-01400]|uniref:glycosyltransferase family protein n=1 Tax=unclassified Bacillus cereus group TaxID=2750818 RepID=UPI001F59B57E